MVFNDDLLFIHVPKTAGMAVSRALLNSLPKPVYYAVQAGHEGDSDGATIVEGRRHQRLADADQWFEQAGLPHRIDSFKHVLVMVRNPYALEVSRFHYLQAGHSWDAGLAQDLALAGDFDGFVKKSRWWFDFADYYGIEGRVPSNLRVLRQESFDTEISHYCDDVGATNLELEQVNLSQPKRYAEMITQDLEPLIFEKYRLLFERGFYSRERFSNDEAGTK